MFAIQTHMFAFQSQIQHLTRMPDDKSGNSNELHVVWYQVYIVNELVYNHLILCVYF